MVERLDEDVEADHDAVGTSSIICLRRGRALREAPSGEASRRHEPKFNLRRDAHPELARRAVDRGGPRQQTPARATSHGEERHARAPRDGFER